MLMVLRFLPLIQPPADRRLQWPDWWLTAAGFGRSTVRVIGLVSQQVCDRATGFADMPFQQ